MTLRSLRPSSIPSRHATRLAIVLALGCAISAPAHALRLAHSRVVSAPNAPLQVLVGIADLTPDEQRSLMATLADPAAWERAGVTPPVPLSSLTLRLEGGSSATRRNLRISSPEAAKGPVVDLLLNLGTSEGQRQVQVSVMQTAGGFPGLVSQAQVGGTRAGRGASAGSVAVRQGDTLYGIAQSNAVPDATLYQMLVALWRANPNAFIQNNMNLVKAGATLVVPDAATVRAIDPAEARRIFIEQQEAYARYRARLAGAAAQGAAAAAAASSAAGQVGGGQSTATPESPPQDRLRLSSGQPGQGNAQAQAQSQADAQTSMAKATEDAQQRVDQLERNVKDLNDALAARQGGDRSGSGAAGGGAAGGAGGNQPGGLALPGLGGASSAAGGGAAASRQGAGPQQGSGTQSGSGAQQGSSATQAGGAPRPGGGTASTGGSSMDTAPGPLAQAGSGTGQGGAAQAGDGSRPAAGGTASGEARTSGQAGAGAAGAGATGASGSGGTAGPAGGPGSAGSGASGPGISGDASNLGGTSGTSGSPGSGAAAAGGASAQTGGAGAGGTGISPSGGASTPSANAGGATQAGGSTGAGPAMTTGPGNAASGEASDGAKPQDTSGLPSWLSDNLLIILTAVLALVAFVIAWLLRRAAMRRDEDQDDIDDELYMTEIDPKAIDRRLDGINLDLDEPPLEDDRRRAGPART